MLYAFLVSPIHATCPAHFVLLDVITPIKSHKTTSYEAPHCIAISNLLRLPPS
jgi:hypothetical protein